MILFVAVALAAATVPLAGGDLRRLRPVRLAWPGVVIAALVLQVLMISVFPHALPSAIARVTHVSSYALVAAFFWRNRGVPWLWVIGVGGSGNLVAIGANGGVMPASRTALAAAGRAGHGHGFTNSAWRPDEHLRLLGDIFSIPRGWPLANVFSPGDILLVVGTGLFLHATCGSRLCWGAPGRRQAKRARIRAMAPAGMATQPGR